MIKAKLNENYVIEDGIPTIMPYGPNGKRVATVKRQKELIENLEKLLSAHFAPKAQKEFV